MRAGPHFRVGGGEREHTRRSLDIATEHQVLRHRRVAAHARVPLGREEVGRFYIPG